MEFYPPGQPVTKMFDPATMEKYKLGDPVPELVWTVRWVPRLRVRVHPEFRFTVTGKNTDGDQLDSVDVRCSLSVPGLLPYYGHHTEIPDSLQLRQDGLDVEPNPFTVSFTIQNVSHQVGMIRRVILYIPTSDGLSLSPSSPNPSQFDPNLTLSPGESETYEWVIDVANRIARRNVKIQVIAYDDEGNPAVACSRHLPIANLKTALLSGSHASATKLRYDPTTDSYDPQTFTYTGIFHNCGGANLHEIVAELRWADESGLDLIELDPDYSIDNTNPKTRTVLFPGQVVDFTWTFRLKNRNSSTISQNVGIFLEYGSRETPYIVNSDSTYCLIEIEPSKPTGATASPQATTCELLPNHPNPFTSSTIIHYAIPRAMPVTLIITDALGCTVRRLHDAVFHSAGRHSVRFEAGELSPGIYFIRLTVGETAVMRKIVRLG
jgi:hypothetical protein